MSRAARRESQQAEFTPHLLLSNLHSSQWKTVPEKALTISGADLFTRRGGTCRLHAIFMNQLSIIRGYQEELSSTAVCPRAEGVYSVNDQGRVLRLPTIPRATLSFAGCAPRVLAPCPSGAGRSAAKSTASTSFAKSIRARTIFVSALRVGKASFTARPCHARVSFSDRSR